MSEPVRYIGPIPVVPKHFSMFDFLNLCKGGAGIVSDVLNSEVRKTVIDGSWTIIETEQHGFSSRAIVEMTRDAISHVGVTMRDTVSRRVESRLAILSGLRVVRSHGKLIVVYKSIGQIVYFLICDGWRRRWQRRRREQRWRERRRRRRRRASSTSVLVCAVPLGLAHSTRTLSPHPRATP